MVSIDSSQTRHSYTSLYPGFHCAVYVGSISTLIGHGVKDLNLKALKGLDI